MFLLSRTQDTARAKSIIHTVCTIKMLRSVVVYVVIGMVNVTGLCMLKIVKNSLLCIIVVNVTTFCGKEKLCFFCYDWLW